MLAGRVFRSRPPPAAIWLSAMALATQTHAADYTVTNQVEFDAAISAATQSGSNDTINVDAVNISSGPSLMLPAAASSLVINFNGQSGGPAVYNPTFDVGFGVLGQTLGLGAGTTLNFNTDNGIASLRVGFANGVTAGTGTVNMTGGTINGIFSGINNYFTLNVGRGSPGSQGTFNQSGGSIFINGGAFNLGVAEATGVYTMSGDARLDMGPGTVCIGCADGNGTLTVGGNAQFLVNDGNPPAGNGQVYIGDGGTGLVIQNGAGSRVVLNAQNGTHLGFGGGTGEYRLSAGQLEFGGVSSGNAGLNLGDSVGGTGTFTQTGGQLTLTAGQIRFGRAGAGTGTYDLNGGTLRIGVANPFAANTASYEFNLGGGTIQALTGFSTNLAFSLTGGTSTIDTNGFNAAFTGVLDGVGALSKVGAGALTLSGDNTYSGGTVLGGGTVIVGSSTAFGTGDVTFAGSTTLQFAGNYTLANDMTIDSSVVATMNTIANTDALDGVIGGAGALLKTGTGTLILNAVNTYTGGTEIAAGTLRLGTGGSLAATGALQIDTLGTFDINDNAQIIVGSLAGDGAVIGAGQLVAGGNNASTAFSGSVAGSLVKIGTGTMLIDGATLGSTFIAGGAMAQTSGNTAIAYMGVGEQPGGTGTLDVSGGVLSIGDALQVGDFGGTGTVSQTGGTVNVGSSFNLGNQGGTGTYDISGGQLNLTALLNNIGRSTTGDESTGTMNISGTGVVDVSNDGINPSRLIISNGSANGTINQTGGTLRIHDGSTFNLSGNSAETSVYNLYGGTLEIGGTGALQAAYLNPNPNYEFNFGGGTLKVIEAALTTTVDATLVAGTASTIDTNGLGATWGGVLSGGGLLNKSGAGTLLLDGINTYTGGTWVSAGTVQLGGNDRLWSAGALQIDIGAVFDLDGHAQTVGDFYGAGTLILGGGGAVGDFTTSSANTTEFSGSITGDGSFTKEGSGTLYLTGDSDYTGATILDGGRLMVNGSLTSQVTVESGTLGGNGTVGGLIVTGGGATAPGNSIGTINVNGIVVFDPQSVYQVEVGPAGQTDLIDATGVATMNGGTVAITALGPVSLGTRYTILTAAGGRNGEFDGVSGNFAFITPTLGYDPTDVFLTFARNSTDFADVAQTRNQRATASALDRFPPGNQLFDLVLTSDAADARRAFDALSGEVHASAAGVLVMNSFYVRDAIFSRLIQASYSGAPGEAAGLGAGGPTTVAVLDPASRMSLGAGLDDIGAATGGAPAYGRGLAFWTRGFGAWGDLNGDGNAGGVNRTLGGFVSGVDAGLGGGWRAGLATGYMRSDIGLGARSSSADVDSYILAGYAGGATGPFAFRSGGAWTWNSLATTRNVSFPGLFEIERASYDAGTGQLFAELAYPLLFDSSAVEPFAGLSYVHVGSDGFAESGPIAGLVSGGTDQNVGISLLGIRAGTSFPVHGLTVTPHGSLAWQYAFGDVTPAQAFAFASTGVGFGIAGVPVARSSALIQGGIDLNLDEDLALGLTYSGQLADDFDDNSVQGRFNWRF